MYTRQVDRRHQIRHVERAANQLQRYKAPDASPYTTLKEDVNGTKLDTRH
jgi:hypothetical protein